MLRVVGPLLLTLRPSSCITDHHTTQMAPRKSLPASLATPAPAASRKRNAPNTTPSRPNKRQRRVQEELTAEPEAPSTPPDAEITVDGAEALKKDVEMSEEDMEAELEAWQDFAADHYEMVEQLPLELHRNFRLLRELDDGCTCEFKLVGKADGGSSKRAAADEDARIPDIPTGTGPRRWKQGGRSARARVGKWNWSQCRGHPPGGSQH